MHNLIRSAREVFVHTSFTVTMWYLEHCCECSTCEVYVAEEYAKCHCLLCFHERKLCNLHLLIDNYT